MPAIAAIIEALIANFFMHKPPSVVRKSKLEWALLGLASLCMSICVFFLVLALYEYLTLLYAPYIAALITAGGLFVPGVIALLVRATISRKENLPPPQSLHDQLSDKIHIILKEICDELEGPIKDNPKIAVLLAALAGLFLTRRI
jgi:hypothetical protein